MYMKLQKCTWKNYSNFFTRVVNEVGGALIFRARVLAFGVGLSKLKLGLEAFKIRALTKDLKICQKFIILVY
jgi:hypothetical protein